MRVIVIGSGLIGLTTAYLLRKSGYEVTVIDREEGAGRDTSFANGALLTPAMAEPWNAPGSWRVLLKSLVQSDAAIQLHLREVPALAAWGVQFLRNSNPANFHRNALLNLRLSLYSLEVMRRLRQETSIQFGHSARGSLKIFRNPVALEDATNSAHRLLSDGLRCRVLSREETIELEPALTPIASQLAGALHNENDETGDAYRFCVALADRSRDLGIEFRFRTEVSALEVHSSRVSAVLCGHERFVADRYVLAAGSYSTPLLRGIGLRLPVMPAKGYSVTFAQGSLGSPLQLPVIDDQLHAGIVPLEGATRVVGTAEFAGFDRTIRQERIQNLLRLLRELLPDVRFDPAAAKPWCGLRPMSADGVPVVGPTPIENLLLNTGHGHLGWTMAAGSAQVLADLISGRVPSIDPRPYFYSRFASGL